MSDGTERTRHKTNVTKAAKLRWKKKTAPTQIKIASGQSELTVHRGTGKTSADKGTQEHILIIPSLPQFLQLLLLHHGVVTMTLPDAPPPPHPSCPSPSGRLAQS